MSFAIFFLSLGVSKIFEASKLVLTGKFSSDKEGIDPIPKIRTTPKMRPGFLLCITESTLPM